MKRNISSIERVGGWVIGSALIFVGVALIALGVTFLPVIGILAAIPLMAISLYFLNLKVEVDEVEEAREVVCEGNICWCPLPSVFSQGDTA